MDRMGHSSTRAALIYLHSSEARQRMLAAAIGQAAALRSARQPQHLARKWHEVQVRCRNRARPEGLEPPTGLQACVRSRSACPFAGEPVCRVVRE